eukprot:CAMPEP_0173242658 /NCGR_PEP_ID=MMETSP1142-20121109/15068_1 /TAXON_ID=483371 /ORGANISM="non described non described, Strain CCMP2298" /LENGTH=226 /DNA_ID=CAMNT_0014174163 /DNA_START=124 /DNA_END=801 /DNA_ORIENTATION=+
MASAYQSAPACPPPRKAITSMPAASAASTPAAESSTTMHLSGATPIFSAEYRNRSGAGLPLATSSRVNTLSPGNASCMPTGKRAARGHTHAVTGRVQVRHGVGHEGLQAGREEAQGALDLLLEEAGGQRAPDGLLEVMAAWSVDTPEKSLTQSSTDKSKPAAASASTSPCFSSASLSTSTPSQSHTTRDLQFTREEPISSELCLIFAVRVVKCRGPKPAGSSAEIS